MGLLAETKRSVKISNDPNNTKWSRDTNTFGQKILRSQGWQPGDYLGAKDAPHAEFHTAANASFVRVALKEDQKGLGFNKRQEDEVTGLDVFSDLLSRLNGKSEGEIVEAQQSRMVVKTNLYVERKWGPMRFVKGGLLVGDDMRELTEEATPGDGAAAGKKDTNSRKRKAEHLSPNSKAPAKEDEATQAKRRKEEKKKKSKKLRNESTIDNASAVLEQEEAKALRRKEKKEKKEKKRLEKEAKAQISDGGAALLIKNKDKESKVLNLSAEDDASEKKRMRKEKKEKKEKKEEKKKRRKGEKPEEDATTGTPTPVAAVSGTSTPSGSRNFVRSRFIAQKRQAVLDTKALNQIFMMKA